MSTDEAIAYKSIIDELFSRYRETPKDAEHISQYISDNYQSECIPKILHMIQTNMMLGAFCEKNDFHIKIIIRLGELCEIKPQYNCIIERGFKPTEHKNIESIKFQIEPIAKLLALKPKYLKVPHNGQWRCCVHDHIQVVM